jgi:hypothetical protein
VDKPFYVTDGMNKIGPFSKDEVLHMLYNAHISLLDYIVDSRDNRMCPLLQHEDFGGDGGTHSLTGSGGIAGLTPENLSAKFGFGDLRKQTHKDREEKKMGKLRKEREENPSHLKRVIDAKPELAAKEAAAATAPASPIPSATTAAAVAQPPAPAPAPAPVHSGVTNYPPSMEIDEETTTTTLKTNNSVNFYLKVKDKEYGPLKFLVLLSLLKQNKLTAESSTRSENEKGWRKLSDYLPKELQTTIQVTPILNAGVLPKNQWKRKNVRVDYEEMVLINNPRYSLVGKSIDLSAEGIAVIWVYDVPLNEEFEISLFDLEKSVITVKGRLSRRELISNQNGIPFYKAVFIFRDKIQIKNFIA